MASRSARTASSSTSHSASATVTAAAVSRHEPVELRPSGGQLLELVVERDGQLHLLDDLVLHVGLVALERGLVVLQGLQLAGRGDAAAVELAVDVDDLGLDRRHLVLEPLLGAGDLVAPSLHRHRLLLDRHQLLTMGRELVALGERESTMPQLLGGGVVLLEHEELIE